VPGSGNLLGGRARIIRHFAAHREDALFRDFGYKMALGYNPKSTQSWKGTRPTTRMGAYSHLEKRFDEVLQKEGKARAALEKKLADAGEGADGEAKKALARKEYELELTTEEQAAAWFSTLPKPGQWENAHDYDKKKRIVTLKPTVYSI